MHFKTLKGQLVQMTALMATTFEPTDATSNSPDSATRRRFERTRMAKQLLHKVVITCPVCKKNGHDTNDCWFNAENKLKEASKMKSRQERR
jgi:hypothetical protein